MNTLCDFYRKQIESHPHRVAVHHRGCDTTYGQLGAQAGAFAAWLIERGLSKGDRVALLIPNSAEYVACYLGILQAGGIAVALNPDTTAAELTYTLNDASPLAVVAGSKAAGALAKAAGNLTSIRAAAQVDGSPDGQYPESWQTACLEQVLQSAGGPTECALEPGDLAQIIYTSGTTGRPKGVTLSHGNLVANCRSILDYLSLTSKDSVFVTLPFYYSYGNSLLFTHLTVGGRLVLASDFVFWNRALDLMQEQQVTGFSGVPSSYAMLLHKSDFGKRSFPHLRYMTCAGGGLAPAVVERLRHLLPEVELFLMYGQTEATARLSTLMPDEIEAKLGSIGRGIAGVDLTVLDENGDPAEVGEVGEIVARGGNLMQGYWNDPAATAKVMRPEGLRTGDLARVDEDGYIYIVGRSSDMIKSGAHRINPQEIEQEILRVQGVAEAAVVGLSDPIWGESPVAFVVLSATEEAPSAEEILDHCRRTLPRYKSVRQLCIVESLPKTSSGKVKRGELRAAYESSPMDAATDAK